MAARQQRRATGRGLRPAAASSCSSACARKSLEQLAVQIVAVGHHHDGRVLHLRLLHQLAGESSTMEMLLPEPWVCQTMPPLREPGSTLCRKWRALRICLVVAAARGRDHRGLHRLAHRVELVIAGDLLDDAVVALLEQDEVAQVIQQQLGREEAAHHLLQLEFQQAAGRSRCAGCARE